MSREEYAYETEELGPDDKAYTMELLNADEGRVITLVCLSTKKLTPDEFVQALRDYAAHIEGCADAGEALGGLVN